jgi:hypothetical protein
MSYVQCIELSSRIQQNLYLIQFKLHVMSFNIFIQMEHNCH